MAKSSMRKWVVIGIPILIVLIVGLTIWSSYNRLVILNQNVEKGWADVEAQYQRRFDLIPNLVSVVESYAGFERSVLTDITALRTQWQSSQTVNQQIQTANQLESTLSKLLLIVENYPELKAGQQFISLQDSLAETENMISVARTRYNGAVRDYNAVVRFFPSNVIAAWFGFEEREYFEAVPGSETAPVVDIEIS